MAEPASPVCFDEELVSRYGGRGPRYTSYPTALQFSESFTADDYRRNAIASNDIDKPLSLYVHIPFCSSLCYYCACNKIVTRNAARVQSYLHTLQKEIQLQATLFDRGRKVRQLHFGGGTPTYLNGPDCTDGLAGQRVQPRTAQAARSRSKSTSVPWTVNPFPSLAISASTG
jgi:oxygen-independent coproporphyrinogen-3 oxidase